MKHKLGVILLLPTLLLIGCEKKTSKSSKPLQFSSKSDNEITSRTTKPIPTEGIFSENINTIPEKERIYQHYKSYTREAIIEAYAQKEEALTQKTTNSCFFVAEKCIADIEELKQILIELSIINTIAIMKTTGTDLYPRYASSKYSNDAVFFKYRELANRLNLLANEEESQYINRVQGTLNYFNNQHFCKLEELTCENTEILVEDDIDLLFSTADQLDNLHLQLQNEKYNTIGTELSNIKSENITQIKAMRDNLLASVKTELDTETKTFEGIKKFIIDYLVSLNFDINAENFSIGENISSGQLLFELNPRKTLRTIMKRNEYLVQTFATQLNHLTKLEDKNLRGIILLDDEDAVQKYENGILYLNMNKDLVDLEI